MTYFNDTYETLPIEKYPAISLSGYILKAYIINLLPHKRYFVTKRPRSFKVFDRHSPNTLNIPNPFTAIDKDALVNDVADYLKRCNHGV